MKKNIYSVVVLSSIIILIVNLFTKSEYLTDIIVFSANLFIKNIFPSVFPMFVISGILVEIGIPQFLGCLFHKVFRTVFKAPGAASFVFFMSMITGFPSSAKYINDLIDKKIINQKEANKILVFTFFSNPLFIINTIGNNFLQNKTVGFYIFISHILGNIIVGLLFRNFNDTSNDIITSFSSKDLINRINNTNFFKIIFNSIRASVETLVNIFGIITFFIIIINIMFKSPNNFSGILVAGIAEMTTGLKYLSISDLSFNIKILTSTFFVSFGGLSVHTQIMDILKEKKVKYLPFLIARVLHAVISTIIVFFILFTY